MNKNDITLVKRITGKYLFRWNGLLSAGWWTNKGWNVFSFVCLLPSDEQFLVPHGKKWRIALCKFVHISHRSSCIEWGGFRPGFDEDEFKNWLIDLKWTPELAFQWQKFYDNASRWLIYGEAAHLQFEDFDGLPKYENFQPEECTKSLAIREHPSILVTLMQIVMRRIFLRWIKSIANYDIHVAMRV